MAYTLLFTPEFLRDAKKLPQDLLRRLKQKLTLFEHEPFHPSLRSHKLGGSLDGFCAFSVNYRVRALFKLLPNHEILMVRIGGHSVYD